MKRKLDIGKKRLIGLVAGIIAGVSYGTNPLFGKALIESGVPILVMLFFRYGIAAAILAVWMLLRKETFRAGRREIGLLVLLGLFFAGSSLTLFFSYDYIPSGLATTLVYLYPVFVALIMVFLRIYPSGSIPAGRPGSRSWPPLAASSSFPPPPATPRSASPASCWPSGRPCATPSIWWS